MYVCISTYIYIYIYTHIHIHTVVSKTKGQNFKT